MPRVKRTYHHLNPRSRISELTSRLKNPPKEFLNKIRRRASKDKMVHDCWHILFHNMFAWEAIEQIRLWATDDLNNFNIFLDMKYRMAWYIVFGPGASPKQAISAIEQDWWPEYPSLKAFKRNPRRYSKRKRKNNSD